MNSTVDLRRLCKLDEDYQVQFVKNLKDRDENPVAGIASALSGVRMDAALIGHWQFPALYLHEVAHVIAFRAGLFDAPDSDKCPHNRYFAVILAVLYRRAGLLNHLKLYDFTDTSEHWNGSGPMPADGLIIRRFAYIIRRSAQLAPLPLTVEHIAEKIYWEDFEPTWINQAPTPSKVSRWRAWFGIA
ncbi:MAG TPA: hypothetical protein VMV75_11130 [Sulfuricella sp.]|nr:hypothetical protein [Sulfuricella sp.]